MTSRREQLFQSHRWPSPLGDLLLAARDGRLILCDWDEGCHRTEIERKFEKAGITFEEAPLEDAAPVVKQAIQELEAYFRGELHTFTVSIEIFGTDYEKRVREALLAIPVGELRTYGEIAEAAGSPKGAQAAGRAIGLNPLSIIVPCHRVIGANGELTGYGGGLLVKERLLAIEGADQTANHRSEDPNE